MSIVQVTIRWGAKTLKIDVDTSGPVSAFKAAIEAATTVPAERQQIVGVKGGKLKDDAVLADVLLPGKPLVLIGSAAGTAPIVAPAAPIQFLENLPESERAKMVDPAGLKNLGNTCFAAASIQAMRYLPLLRARLPSTGVSFGSVLNSTMRSLDSSTTAVAPHALVTRLPEVMSAFQLGEQQDAEEFWTSAVQALPADAADLFNFSLVSSTRPWVPPTDNANGSGGAGAGAAGGGGEVVLTGIDAKVAAMGANPTRPAQGAAAAATGDDAAMSATTTAAAPAAAVAAAPAEPEAPHPWAPAVEEVMRVLPVHLTRAAGGQPAAAGGGGGGGSGTGFPTSLQAALRDQYGPDAIHHITRDGGRVHEQRVGLGSLPEYLAVQYMRFDWNETAKRRLKVMRRLDFPSVLDLNDTLSDSLKAAVAPTRGYIRALEEGEQEALREEDPAAAKARTAAALNAGVTGAALASVSAAVAAAAAAAAAAKIGERPSRMEERGSPGGYYGLAAVVCHQGRSAEGGHYIAWVNVKGQWVKFDDDDVTVGVKERDVLNLAGCADGPSAYLLVYRARDDDGAVYGSNGPLRSSIAKVEGGAATAGAAAADGSAATTTTTTTTTTAGAGGADDGGDSEMTPSQRT